MVKEWEDIFVNRITFRFKNNPMYVDETEELKNIFKIIAAHFEKYLTNEEYIDIRKNQMVISKNMILVWLIHPIIDKGLKSQAIGDIAFYEGNQLIIQIHPVSNYRKENKEQCLLQHLFMRYFICFLKMKYLLEKKQKNLLNLRLV